MGTKVKFAGYIVSQQGIQPDPEKVQCLEQFPTPTDEKGLRSFLGLANQLGNFIPDLSQATKKMRSLLRNKTAFVWSPEIEEEFREAKKILTSPMLIKPFNPQLETQVLTDASRLYGLGYLLTQTEDCLLYTSPSPRDKRQSRMPSSA